MIFYNKFSFKLKKLKLTYNLLKIYVNIYV